MKGNKSQPTVYRLGYDVDGTWAYLIKDKIEGRRRTAMVHIKAKDFKWETGDEEEVVYRKRFLSTIPVRKKG